VGGKTGTQPGKQATAWLAARVAAVIRATTAWLAGIRTAATWLATIALATTTRFTATFGGFVGGKTGTNPGTQTQTLWLAARITTGVRIPTTWFAGIRTTAAWLAAVACTPAAGLAAATTTEHAKERIGVRGAAQRDYDTEAQRRK